MSAVLYEPVFAIVGQAIADPGGRLRAIATITVFGGLASTFFLPLTAALVTRFGWRDAVLLLAAAMAITALGVHRVTFNRAIIDPRRARISFPRARFAIPSRLPPGVPARQELPVPARSADRDFHLVEPGGRGTVHQPGAGVD